MFIDIPSKINHLFHNENLCVCSNSLKMLPHNMDELGGEEKIFEILNGTDLHFF